MYEKSWKDLIIVPKRASSCLSARRVQKPDKTLAVSHPSASNRNCHKRWWCKMRLRFTPREGIKPDKLQVMSRFYNVLEPSPIFCSAGSSVKGATHRYKTRQAASQCERCAVPSTRLKSQMSEVWWFVCIASPFPDRRLSSVLPTSWSYLSFACQRFFVPNADIQLFAMLVNPGWFVVNGC